MARLRKGGGVETVAGGASGMLLRVRRVVPRRWCRGVGAPCASVTRLSYTAHAPPSAAKSRSVRTAVMARSASAEASANFCCTTCHAVATV